jgi:flagellar biosynthesis/type III secretory pathway chaperone
MSPSTLPAITQLCRLLRQEEATCHQLLETVHAERAAIRTLAITEFHSINCRRLAILESLQSLVDEQQRLIQELSWHYGLKIESASIQELIDNIEEPASADLQAVYRRYMAVTKTVRDEIKHNIVLIEGIRGVVDQALSTGTPVAPGRDLYTADGQSFVASRVNVLIHQQG